ncbi:ribulose-phosphate 3-epimerase [Peptoniphilus equinus]|uniref:Ribulose-phosphate 3-epimerase n=1 Tax=Peptoniphilus equinus TaxID=3016343 RepID=A0ABY7QR35_9FIRM|nr:ribulose-phosphate 3-epimerase [Peptoniphilus equinus]WBW49248.1 ribulose-phosphate 3-epimerase [Peptoniphilus equinus]
MIAPSILSCDFSNMKQNFDVLNEGPADYVHVDIMDGNYVPNISFGPDIVKDLRKLSTIPFDVHLMIEHPEQYINVFFDAGADILTVHPQTTAHLSRTLQAIKAKGIKAGIAINPAESLDVLNYTIQDLDLILIMSVNPGFGGQSFITTALDKIKAVRKLIDEKNPSCLLEVDGGIKLNNAQAVYDAGADIIVAGSAIFGATDPLDALKQFRELRP